jgi:hypothetical protein
LEENMLMIRNSTLPPVAVSVVFILLFCATLPAQTTPAKPSDNKAPGVFVRDDTDLSKAIAKTMAQKDGFAYSFRLEREFALPKSVILRGTLKPPDVLTADLWTVFDTNASEEKDPASPIRIEGQKILKGSKATGFSEFVSDWLPPALFSAACWCGMLGPLWSAASPTPGCEPKQDADTVRFYGQVGGDTLVKLLAPLDGAYSVIHPLNKLAARQVWCNMTIDVNAKDGLVHGFQARLQLTPNHFYRFTAALCYKGEAAFGEWEAWLDTAPEVKETDPAVLREPDAKELDGRIDKGAAYLLSIQKKDGSWNSGQAESCGYKAQRIAITAVVLHALTACMKDKDDKTRAAVIRGVESLRQMMEEKVLENAGISEDTWDFSPWGPAFGLIHLDGVLAKWPAKVKAPDMSDIARSYMEFAWKKQKPCGGWHYRADANDGSVTIITAAMVEGMVRWQKRGVKPDEKKLKLALTDLGRNRDEKGSFPYFHEGKYEQTTGDVATTPESAGRSVQAQYALVMAGIEKPETLGKHIDRFFKERKHFVAQYGVYPHSPPYYISGYYYYFAHYFTACAMPLAGLPDEDRAKYRKIILCALAQEQKEDGSWLETPAGGEPYATAMALLTIKMLQTK